MSYKNKISSIDKYNIFIQIFYFIKYNAYFLTFFLSFTGVIVFLYFYFYNILVQNNHSFVDNTLTLFKKSFIYQNENIINGFEKTLNIHKNSIPCHQSCKIYNYLEPPNYNNFTQNDFMLLTQYHFDPYKHMYYNYRFSNLVYHEDIVSFNTFGKNNINSQFEIKYITSNNDEFLLNKSYYIPYAYSSPLSSEYIFGQDLTNILSINNNFFYKFTNLNNKVITSNILFNTSIDPYDLGIYCGIINYQSQYCNITYSSSFNNLVNYNKHNKKCLLGFNYITLILRDYISNILNSLDVFYNIQSSDISYIAFNINNTHKQLISRSINLINIDVNKLKNIDNFSKQFFKTIVINDFFKFQEHSINDNIVLYLFFDKSISNIIILRQIFILNIFIFLLYFLLSNIFIIFYIIYIHQLNISNNKYIETKKLMTYVNHELRNPLNIIYGLSQVIEKKINIIINNLKTFNSHIIDSVAIITSLNEIHSNILTIYNSTRFGSIIVNDVIDLQKLEDNRIVINNINFTSIDLINDIYKSILYKINDLDSCVKTLFYVDQNISFYTDKDRLIQIIINLYTNSFKFTKNGFILISIRLDYDSQHIIISIIDTGCGIPYDIQHNIFKKPFIKNKSIVDSIGIGLYITSMISKILDFNINFISIINKGTSFHIKIKNTFFSNEPLINHSLSSINIIDKITIIKSKNYNEQNELIKINNLYNSSTNYYNHF
jgi:signal transduction histidine kinase